MVHALRQAHFTEEMNKMNGTIKINADLSCRHAPERIFAKQGDIDSRFIEVSFFFGGEPFDLAQVTKSEIRVRKPDSTMTVSDGVKGSKSIIFPLTAQSLNVSGNASADFLLYGGSGEVISSIPAKLMIIGDYNEDEPVVSPSEYQSLLDEIRSLAAQLNSFKTQSSNQFTQMSSQMTALTQKADSLDSSVKTLTEQLGSIKLRPMAQSAYDSLGDSEKNDPFSMFIITEG